MSSLVIQLDLDNDAFSGDDCGPEIARILEELARCIRYTSREDLEGHEPVPRDSNGNRCGTVDFDIEEEVDPEEERRQKLRDEAEEAVDNLTRTQATMILKEYLEFDDTSDLLRHHLDNRIVGAILDGDISIDLVREFAAQSVPVL